MAIKKSGGNANKIDGLSPDIQQEKIDALKKLVPEAFSDGKIDAEKLKRVIGENNIAGDERYRLEWAGKREVFDEIAKRSACTLTLDEKRSSKDWRDSNNIFIEGENLEVLRTLQKAYHGKVKMIYIDPPYNTGKDFVYNDNFRQTEEEYCDDECNVDENGNIKKAYKLNSRDSGRFHSNWLSMMYPRLYLARNLLREDGVIFVSIDDNEVHNLRLIMNEIFGEENFFADLIVVRSEGGGLAKRVIKGHDNLLVFVKSLPSFPGIFRPKDIRGKIIEKDGKQYWIEEDWLRKEFGKYGTCLYEEIEKYKGLEKKQEIDEGLKNGLYQLIKKGDGHIVGRLRALDEDGSKFYSVLKHLNKNGIEDLENLSLDKYFDFPKPVSLIKELILGATIFTKNEGEIILDFFSGSGTTAHAVIAQNAEDGGNRRYICVQMPEETPEGSEARKAEYKKISDISIDRIKKAAAKIKAEHPEFNGDLSVRVYKESDSNFPQWHARAFESDEALKQTVIDYSKEKVTGTTYDRATELLLKLGYPLTTPLVEKDGCFVTPDGVVLALDSLFTVENLKKVLKDTPKTIVALEKIFKKDEDKINFGLRCKEAGVIFQTV